jgi:hypothetical protein
LKQVAVSSRARSEEESPDGADFRLCHSSKPGRITRPFRTGDRCYDMARQTQDVLLGRDLGAFNFDPDNYRRSIAIPPARRGLAFAGDAAARP